MIYGKAGEFSHVYLFIALDEGRKDINHRQWDNSDH